MVGLGELVLCDCLTGEDRLRSTGFLFRIVGFASEWIGRELDFEHGLSSILAVAWC